MKTIRFLLAICLVSFAKAQTEVPAQAAQPGAMGEKGLIEHAGVSGNYRKLSKAHAAGLPDRDGAIGRNRKAFSDVAAQRGALWLLPDCIINKNLNGSKNFDTAIRAMEYGFKHQTSDGYFENGLGASPVKAIEADAFFLQAYARIALMIEDSPYRKEFEPRLEQLKPRLILAMKWLSENAQELHKQDHKAVNRLWFDALAFRLNGFYLNDQHLLTISRKFIDEALKGQRPDGSFNEHNGSDNSYQAVSMLNIAILLSYEKDPAVAKALKASLVRAADWELPHIDANGMIDPKGNSRTGLNQETFFGKPKEINDEEVAQALLYTSYFADSPELSTKADKIIAALLERAGY